MKLYFRLDANELIGGGHLFRCMSYANYFKKKFTKITFIIRSTPKHLKNIILKNNFEYIEMNIDPKQFSKKNEKIEISILEKILNKKDILIIDHYYLTEGYKKYINYKLCKIFVLSDRLIKQSNYSIINYSPFSDQFNNTKSNFFYGLNYAPFRNNYIHKFKFQRNINNYNVLINLGISYKSDINKILKIISKINISSSFTIFIPTTNKLDNIQKLKLNNLKIIVFKNLGDLMPLYKKIHFAIGAFGYSSLERLYCGIPQILIQTAINQKYNVKFFKEYKLGYILKKITRYELIEGFRYLTKYSQKINIYAPLLFLNNEKYINNIFLNKLDNKKIINFLPPEKKDCEYIYNLQNLKKIRDFFINNEVPTIKDHNLWFNNMLKSCDDLILILNNSRNKKIGFIQISFNKKVFFLSILIDKKYQNNGFATIVIDILKKVYSKKYNLRAVIHEDNKPSLSLFKKNGFSKIKHLNNKFHIYEY